MTTHSCTEDILEAFKDISVFNEAANFCHEFSGIFNSELVLIYHNENFNNLSNMIDEDCLNGKHLVSIFEKDNTDFLLDSIKKITDTELPHSYLDIFNKTNILLNIKLIPSFDSSHKLEHVVFLGKEESSFFDMKMKEIQSYRWVKICVASILKKLKGRHREIFSFMLQGYSRKEISTMLGMEESTYDTTRRKLLNKFFVKDREELEQLLELHNLKSLAFKIMDIQK